MKQMTQDDRIQEIGDNVALLFERSSQHASQLNALFAKMDARHSGGCALHADMVRRVLMLEERPSQTIKAAAGVAAVISAVAGWITWLIRGNSGQ